MAKRDTRLMLRLPPEIHEKLNALANANVRSLNGEIIFLLGTLLELAEAPYGSPEFVQSVRRLRAGLLPLMPDDHKGTDSTRLLAEIQHAYAENPPALRPAPEDECHHAPHTERGQPAGV